MKHIRDLTHRGREIVIMLDEDGTYVVDIRENDTDGEMIAGFSGLESEPDARRKAFATIDELIAKDNIKRLTEGLK